MATSQNGFPVIFAKTMDGAMPHLRLWKIPNAGNRTLLLRDGAAGFLLCHNASWFDVNIERLDLGVWDEWGWNVRAIRGQTSGYSNHASGTASDLNATRHPRGVDIHKTFTNAQINKIHHRLDFYEGCLRWGGDYQHSEPDGMHFEINKDIAAVEKRAKALLTSPIGKKVLELNPGAKQVILS